jgi:hypothetical protein
MSTAKTRNSPSSSALYGDYRMANHSDFFPNAKVTTNFATPQRDRAYISRFTSATGPVVKIFSFVGGKVTQKANAAIYQGQACTLDADEPQELQKVLNNLLPNQAVGLGVLKVLNTSMPLTKNAHRNQGEIARTKEFFHHNEGAGWGLIDVDTKDLPDSVIEKLECKNIVLDIFRCVPELRDTAYLVRPSSSAGITKPDGTKREATGYHIFFRLEYAPDLPHILKIMHERCWLAGLGYLMLSKSGSILERSPIDLAVSGAERLIFEAPPKVIPPLKRVRPSDWINSGKSLGNLPDVDAEEVEKLKYAARAEIKPAAAQASKQYAETQVERIQAQTKVSKTEARRIFRQRMSGKELSDDDVLETSRGKFELIGDFLDRVTRAYGMPCPIEGSEYGTTTAYFYPDGPNGPEPLIISFAHGVKTVFRFERYRHLRGTRWLPK